MAKRPTSKQKQPNDVQAILDADRDPDAAVFDELTNPYRVAASEARQHCERMGIDPDSVSEAVRHLARKFKRGPLEILWELADDENNSRSGKLAAASAILPYLAKRTVDAPKAPVKQAPAVMIVPMAQSMEEWMAAAQAQQAALKGTVRE